MYLQQLQEASSQTKLIVALSLVEKEKYLTTRNKIGKYFLIMNKEK